MGRLQGAQIAQEYGWVCEHVGDLTHRMAEHFSWREGSYGTVRDKVAKTLRALRDPGFNAEITRQIASNVAWNKKPAQAKWRKPHMASAALARETLAALGRAYSGAHAQLRVYNRMQACARGAAKALGRRDLEEAGRYLGVLEFHLDRGREHWFAVAGEYDPGFDDPERTRLEIARQDARADAHALGPHVVRSGSRVTLLSTTIRWSQLPDDVRSDAFLLESIRDSGLRRPQGSTVLTVAIRSLDTIWPLLRAVFPGRDIDGYPAGLDGEDHWDDRGPAHAVTLKHLIEAVFLDPATATPEEVLQKWMGEDREVTWQEPEVAGIDMDYDHDLWPGHSSMASTVATIGPPHPGMLLPPLVIDADGFVDGRHRIYGARLAGLRYVPVLDLSQLPKR